MIRTALLTTVASVIWLTCVDAAAQLPTFVRGPGAVLSSTAISAVANSGVFTLISGSFTESSQEDIIVGMGVFPPTSQESVPVRFLRNMGNGSFADQSGVLFATPAPSIVDPRAIVLGDFNNDGRADVFVANHGYDQAPFAGEANTLLISDGAGHLANQSASLPKTPDFSHTSAVADINGDNNQDIYVGNIWGEFQVGPYFLIGDGKGNFAPDYSRLPAEMASLVHKYTAATLVDVNGDGFPDLVLGADAGSDSQSWILFNDRLGKFSYTNGTLLPPGSFGNNTIVLSILAMDVNSDGYPDLLLTETTNHPFYAGGAIQLLMSDGSGHFVDETSLRLPSGVSQQSGPWIAFLRGIDANGDGPPDFYAQGIYGASSSTVQFLWVNDGTGHFTAVDSSTLEGDFPFQVVMTDTNKDGLPDVVRLWSTPEGDIGYQTYVNQGSVKPQKGWWWNPAESGRGFFIEANGGNAFIASFLYDPSARATWYAAFMPTTNSGSHFSGTLDSFAGGQTLTGAWRAATAQVGGGGNVTLDFSDALHGMLTWAGGTVPIERLDLGGLTAAISPNQPESGWWWNPGESGRGFSIEIQGSSLFLAGYMYDGNGNPIWYLATGAITGTNTYRGNWQQFAGGQTLTGAYQPATAINTAVGALSIEFSSTTTAQLTLPDGRRIAIERFRF